jgi:serine phosphatase RsbU (regulator of sigma subunit)/anti-sigma regulatory factor (Ser/Thr protein kinase)
MPSTARESARGFPSDDRSVAEARWFVRGELEAWGAADLVDRAILMTSELVTNAVIHAGTPVEVRLLLDESSLRLEVQDLHPLRTLDPTLPRPVDDDEHGRGLLITSAVSSSWGVSYTDAVKRVWVEIDRGAAPDPAPGEVAVGGGADVADAGGGGEVLVAVVELTGSGLVRGWNDDATRLLGWTAVEVMGEQWRDLVDGSGSGLRAEAEQWQGELGLRTKDGSLLAAFARRHAVLGQDGSVLLVVPAAQRGLLERATVAPGTSSTTAVDPLGLRDASMAQLRLDDYLDLAVERCRDLVGADATYLLLARDFDSELEVAAVSGLDARLRGRRVERDAPGTLNRTHPRLPLVTLDLAEGTVPLLAGTGCRSLLVVPVVVEGRVIGALGAGLPHAGGLDDTQSALLVSAAGSLAMATDRARLRAAEVERRHWLGLIDEAGVLLAGSLDQEMTMALTGQVVVPQLASWCAIHLRDERGKLVLQQVWHEDERQLGALREVLEEADGENLALLRAAPLEGPIRSLPLTVRGRDIGLLTLGRPGAAALNGETLQVAESLARRAAMAIDNARVHGELKAAGQALQSSLLPPSIEVPPGLDVGVVYEPAGESTTAGGDFYDLFPLGDGRWCWVVGDVCGTGAEAAAVTGLARHTIRALALTGLPTGVTLERLNAAILDEGERARFLTLVGGVIEPLRDGRAPLGLCVAGHPPPFLVRQGKVEQVGSPQALLGVEERVAYTEDRLELRRGDLLVAVTDGVLERRDGTRILGEEGVLEAELAAVAALPAQAVADRIRRLVLDYVPGAHRDDMAILVIRVPDRS